METNLRYVLEATSLGSCGSRTRLLTGSKHQERTETAPRRPHQHFIHPDAAQQHHDCCAEPRRTPRFCATEPELGQSASAAIASAIATRSGWSSPAVFAACAISIACSWWGTIASMKA